MRLTWKDGVATLLVAGIVTLYTFFQAGNPAPLFGSARMVAAAALVFGLAACITGGEVPSADTRSVSDAAVRDRWMSIMGIFALATFISGFIVLITANDIALAVLIGLVATMWLATTVRHIARPRAVRPTSTPAVAAERPASPKPPISVG